MIGLIATKLFQNSDILNSIGLAWTLPLFFPIHDFEHSHWSLEKFWTTELCRCSSILTRFIIISKKHLLISSLISSGKCLYINIYKVSRSQRQIQVFQNSCSHLKAPILPLAVNAIYLFLLKWQAHFIHSHVNVCQIPKSEKPQLVCQSVVCQIKLWKKVASSAHNPNHSECFSWNSHETSICNKGAWYRYFPFYHREYYKDAYSRVKI